MSGFKRAALALGLLMMTPAAAETAPALVTVPKVDLQRYLGVWHEMARYENWFQGADCVNVTAQYGLQDDGDISVLNTCRDAQGTVTETADGRAYVSDTATHAKLRVSFFWPFFGDYWVVALADDYSWVIVSEPGREYLWILTREPVLRGSATSDELVAKAAALGFDTSKLVYSQVSETAK